MTFLIEMDMPECCFDCPMYEAATYRCRLSNILVVDGNERPNKCHLEKYIMPENNKVNGTMKELVVCKDCIYSDTVSEEENGMSVTKLKCTGKCYGYVKSYDFCSYGIRKIKSEEAT